MQNKDWLEDSSIYRQQHKSFYRWVLYPIISFLILCSFFFVFSKKEVVIQTTAQLTALKTEKVQVPLEAKIKENMLTENKQIKKEEVLVTFQTDDLENEKSQLEQEISAIVEQVQSAQLFIDSLTQEVNLFEIDDAFGYSNQLKSLLAEKESSAYISKQSVAMNQKEQEAYQKTSEQLNQQIVSRKNEVNEWEQVRTAWNNQQDVQGFSNQVTSKYQAWQAQLIDTPEEQKIQMRTATLAIIDEQITQRKKELEQLQGEQTKLVEPALSDNEVNSLNEQLTKSKEQALATTKQKVAELKAAQTKRETALKSITKLIEQGVVKASMAGTIHLNEEVKGQTEVPKGTLIATIYPDRQAEQMTFTALVSASEMTRVKLGMKAHFKLDKKGVSTTTLTGEITEISETSTTTEQGAFYAVKGTLQLTKEFTSRYGLTGELSLIVGEKTYWQQIKDTLLNQE